MRPRIYREFETRQRSNRRWFRAFLSIVILSCLALAFAGAWLVAHPQVIGRYLGAIARGFDVSEGVGR